MKDVVIVFARVPRLGTVKRRLADGIGDRPALRFHAALLDAMLRGFARDRRFRTVAALTPDRARMRLPTRVQRIAQGGGDLGQRMQRAFARFPKARVVLVGSDIPELGSSDLRAALVAVGRADAAFGPAEDGGYWLAAMSPRRPARPFGAVRWSSPDALADTMRNFRHRRVALLRRLNDVDTADDFHRWRSCTPFDTRSPETVTPPPW